MKPFRAFIKHAIDASKKVDVDRTSEKQDPIVVVKGAEFVLETDGECPWPPHSLLGKHVVVMEVDEYRRIKDLAARVS